jgi:hypothetical protein
MGLVPHGGAWTYLQRGLDWDDGQREGDEKSTDVLWPQVLAYRTLSERRIELGELDGLGALGRVEG